MIGFTEMKQVENAIIYGKHHLHRNEHDNYLHRNEHDNFLDIMSRLCSCLGCRKSPDITGELSFMTRVEEKRQ